MPARVQPQATTLVPDASVTYAKLATELKGWVLIAENTLAAPAASVTFAAIPSGYSQLRLICNAINDTAQADVRMGFNADAANNYGYEYFRYRNAALSAGAVVGVGYIPLGSVHTSPIFGNLSALIYNQATGSAKYKTSQSHWADGYNTVGINSGYWNGDVEISSISLSASANNFGTGSRFRLWGLV